MEGDNDAHQLTSMEYKLRKFRESDLERLVQHANNINVSRFMTNRFPYPYTEADGRSFIRMAMRSDPANLFVIEVDGELGGAIGIHPMEDVHHFNAELGYWVAEMFWGQGIATHAVSEMVEYGFTTFPVDRIFARPYGNNKASQRVLEKAGFELEARIKGNLEKHGERLDELIYAIRKR